MSESVIFNVAVKLPPEERSKYLDQACNGDAHLRRRCESLLSGHDQADSFLERPAVARDSGPEATSDFLPVTERPGAVIGSYKLMEQIGEGAFGLVFVAEQQQPVRRKVALKIIKPGMDTKEVVARFEAERQALALMDHPNIAKVFDAGTTQSGRPYFVMELVKGVPIVEYCDNQWLSNKERLQLFISVCHAVQHAHNKGVIHRDLKPSNILIAPHDGVPVVKVIDFGIAKAIGQQLSEKTVYTSFAQMIGTPLYMSPEQAEINALDVDTRSDIYSLGVLLYELLTGTTPFDRERMASAAFEEIRRIIREEEPERPSQRISTLGDTLPMFSKHRSSDPSRLPAMVRGDLDWIVMKALEKNRERRYETANGLAMDVERHLANEPIVARPPSAAYRFSKFVKRNRSTVFATATLSAGLLLGIIGYTWQARVAFDQSQKAAAAQQLASEKIEQAAASGKVVQLVLESFDPELLDNGLPVSTLIENAEKTLGETYRGNQIREARARTAIAEKYRLLGLKVPPPQSRTLWEAALKNHERAVEICRQKLGDTNQETLTQLKALDQCAEYCGDVERQIELRRLQRQILTQVHGPTAKKTLDATRDLAWSLNWHGDFDEAAKLRQQVFEANELELGADHLDTLYALASLAGARHASGEIASAKLLRQRFLDALHDKPDMVSKQNRAYAYISQGEIEKARELSDTPFRVADLGIERWLDGREHPLTPEVPMLVLHWEHWCPWCQQMIERMKSLVSDYTPDELQVFGITGDTENHRAEYFVQRNDLAFPTAKFDATFLDRVKTYHVPAVFAICDGRVVWVGHPSQLTRAFLDGLSNRNLPNSDLETVALKSN